MSVSRWRRLRIFRRLNKSLRQFTAEEHRFMNRWEMKAWQAPANRALAKHERALRRDQRLADYKVRVERAANVLVVAVWAAGIVVAALILYSWIFG